MLHVIDPTTGKTVHDWPKDDPTVVERKLAAAEAAFADWQGRSFAERAEVLRSVARVMRDDKQRLALLMTTEMGKPIREARGEVEKAAWCAEHYADHAAAYLADEAIASDAQKSVVRYLPLGPVLGILPWNAPFWLAFRFLAPALMAGNTCLMKHDSHVPACAQGMVDAFKQAGAPAGLVDTLFISGADSGSIIADDRIQAVSFTGSSGAGAKVATAAAAELKPSVLELGGSDPAVILADADLEEAAKLVAKSRIINAGQSCIAAKRIIVERPVRDAFIDLLTAQLEILQVGDPRSEDTDVGPIARDDLRQELHRQVQETIAAGATCRLGGTLPEGDGFFYPVTLLTGVTNDMVACREETFGPIAVVVEAADADEAVAIANDTEFGLAASVWSQGERGLEVADRLIAGQVVVNGIVKTDPRLPSGGIKKSGYGRELGPHGIREFVNVQQLWVGPSRG